MSVSGIRMRLGWGVLGAGLLLGAWAVRAAEPEPANLYPHKQEVRAYIESGAYLRGVAEVAAQAGAWIEDRARMQQSGPSGPGKETLAVVFDLDETLFSNLPTILKQDFGYVPEAWDAWVGEGVAPALEPVRKVYDLARRLHVTVIFLSSRPERDRAATERNLRAIHCGEYGSLILRPDGQQVTSGDFKLAQRRRLVADGFVLIANLGDQESDFLGGLAERNFKLPNPFYITE